MPTLLLLSSTDQVTVHLRNRILAGQLGGIMPGVLRLEAELGVNRKTVEAALKRLENERLLIPQGPGKRRRINLPEEVAATSLRVGLLQSGSIDWNLPYMVEIQHELLNAGHSPLKAPEAMEDLGMNVKSIGRMVDQVAADAWVVTGAPREVLEWFAGQPVPVLALFGRRRGLRVAAVGPDKSPAYAEVARELVALGHRRIVLLARARRRLPEPGAPEQAFLNELASHGPASPSYHLPDWDDHADGLQACLKALFRVTPPTALFIDEAPLFTAALQFCQQQGLRVPQDLSMVCSDPDPAFSWCRPTIAHIRWDSRPVVSRILRWAANLSRGTEDLRQVLTMARFIPGDTIGPAPAR